MSTQISAAVGVDGGLVFAVRHAQVQTRDPIASGAVAWCLSRYLLHGAAPISMAGAQRRVLITDISHGPAVIKTMSRAARQRFKEKSRWGV